MNSLSMDTGSLWLSWALVVFELCRQCSRVVFHIFELHRHGFYFLT